MERKLLKISFINEKIFFFIFFFTFFTNSYAETVSTTQTLVDGEDSRKTLTEDLTITSTGRIHCEDIAICIVGDEDNLTITNHGIISNDDTDGDDLDILIKGNNDAFDIKIYNYGTIEVDGNSAIFVPNNDDNNGDGVGAYIYNEGTIESGRKLTIRYHSSDYTKIDNYGTITTDNTAGQALHGYDDTFTTINNYQGGTISAPNGTGAIQTKINSSTASTSLTINNWGTITSKNDTIQMGISSTLNNYGSIINTTLDDAAVKMQGDNNTINLYDGTILEGYLEASTFSGSTLNLHLCSSYYFKTTETWSVNDKSGCGSLVYSAGFAQSVSPLFQSVADEIGVLRTDLINEVYDYAKDKIKEEEDFFLPIVSHTKREKASAIDKFENNTSGFAFGFPTENEKIKGHLVFNLSKNKIDLLNQYIEDKTYQVGFFLEDLNFKAILGYHDYEGDRHRLNNTSANGKDSFEQDFKSTSLILGKQFYKKNKNNSYLKFNLDTNFEGFFNHDEESHVTWNSRILGQAMGNLIFGWETLPKNKFQFNPELTIGYRSMIVGKNQKYEFKGNNKTFNGGIKEDVSAKFSLLTHYSFNEESKLFFDLSAKKTSSNQETYLLNIGFQSIF